MKTKIIWTWAVILGLITSGSLYLLLNAKSSPRETTSQTANNQTSEKGSNKTQSGGGVNGTPAQGETPALQIGQGKRAISIAVNEVQGVSGFLTPGQFVDVVALVPPVQGNDMSSQILLQNVKVLAVGVVAATQEKDPKTPVYRTVTLEIPATDGTSLALAGQKGAIHLMLRGSGDAVGTSTANTTLEKLHKGEIAK